MRTKPRTQPAETGTPSFDFDDLPAEPGVRPGTTAGFVEEDGPAAVRLIYQPRTVLGLCAILAVIIYTALHDAEVSLDARIRSGALLCCFTFVGYGAIQFRDSLMVRPHPVVWRVIHALGILLLMLIAFMLPLNIDDVRGFLHILDPELGVPLADKNYGVDCRLCVCTGVIGGRHARP